MARSNTEIAQELQSKYQFYLLGLVFTVLALAVETATFNGPPLADALELLGWVFLLVSGVTGLIRFEGLPKSYQIFDAEERLKHDRTRIANAKAIGHSEVFLASEQKDVPIEAYLRSVNEKISKAAAFQKTLSEKATLRYTIHRWLFVCGIVAIAGSRGLEPFLDLVDFICRNPIG